MDKLAERQKAATAIAKAARAPPPDPNGLAAPRVQRTDLTPQSFSIYCHNTTLADGTQLDNDDPAPEFIIASLEHTTGIKRPDDADKRPLHSLHLHFMNGGR